MRPALVALVCTLAFSLPAQGETLRIGVAVSLKQAVTEIGRQYESKTGDKVEFTFGASGQIMTQIQGGAALDAFISAAAKQVDELEKQGLLDHDTRRIVAGNTLVLVVPPDSKLGLDSFESLARVPLTRLAIGEPKTVPAGQYAMQTLKKLKLEEGLSGKLVFGANVRQVLDYVARGEVSAGVVYATDAREAGDKVKLVATAAEDSHELIVYPAAVVKRSRQAAGAKRFLDFLDSGDARRVLKDKGFKIADRESAGRKP